VFEIVLFTKLFYTSEKNDYFLVLLMLFVIYIDDSSFDFLCVFSFMRPILIILTEPLKPRRRS
jgi:hypothetical protein